MNRTRPERRAQPRRETALPVIFSSGRTETDAMIIELSESAVLLRAQMRSPALGTRVSIFPLHQPDRPIRGVVARNTRRGFVVDLAPGEPSAAFREGGVV